MLLGDFQGLLFLGEFLSSFHILGHWLAGNPCNGHNIFIRQYPMVGFEEFFRLPDVLVQSLHDKGIYYLVQVSTMGGIVACGHNQKIGNDLTFQEELKDEWDRNTFT